MRWRAVSEERLLQSGVCDGDVRDEQIENRQQTELELMRLFPATGEAKTLFVEKSEQWINLHNLLTPLKRQSNFIWASERTG